MWSLEYRSPLHQTKKINNINKKTDHMKKTITLMAFAFGLITLKAQTATVTIDMESFTLTPNSAYSNTNSVPFGTYSVSFQYKWDTGFNFWSGGFAYTNKYDSATAGFGNTYGVKPLKGYNNSSIYVVAQANGIINLSAPSTTVDGFYITNTTYAYKAIRNGDSFSRKFGDTTGTGSGTTIPQGSYPDFFKVTVKGYNNGILKPDSVPFYLADYRFSNNTQDYVLNTWQWVNTSTLGEVDSLKFYMYTSDNGSFGPNTPLFFGMDNFTARYSTAGIHELSALHNTKLFPNPVVTDLVIQNPLQAELDVCLMNMNGSVLKQEKINTSIKWDLTELQAGIYLVKVSDGTNSSTKKFIKQ
jgi:hypothetical protein